MATLKKKVRVVGNPAHKRNPILGLTMNPGRKKGESNTMAKRKAKKKNSGGHRKRTGVRKNSATRSYVMVSKRKVTRRRNAGGNSIADMVIGAVVVVTAAVISKLGAQAVLGDKNTGAMGYAANVAVGAAMYFGASALTKNRTILSAIASGTAVQVVLRAANDYTPLGQYVKDLGVGDYQVQAFVTPQVLVDPHRSAEIAIPNGWGRGEVIMMPTPVSGVGDLYSGNSGANGLYAA